MSAPPHSHAEITIASLEAGCHVNCEKPMAKTAQEARAMAEAAERTGKKLTIAYQNRFRRDSQYLKALCERGDLGEIYYAKAKALRRRAVPTWGVFLDKEQQGGGPLIDIGTHALDLTLWMMDNYRPRYCVGTVYHKLNKRENAANAWGPWDPEKFQVEDSAFGFIVMEDGATIVLESSWALNTLLEGEARTILHGTEGGADMEDGLRINGEEFSTLYTKKPVLDAGGVAFYEGESESPADLEMRCWIESILNDTEPGGSRASTGSDEILEGFTNQLSWDSQSISRMDASWTKMKREVRPMRSNLFYCIILGEGRKTMRPAVTHNLKRKFAHALDLPPNVVLDHAVIQILGDGEVKIINHKGLVQYTTSAVKAKSVQGMIEVGGLDLEIASFSAQEIKIRGQIRQVILK